MTFTTLKLLRSALHFSVSLFCVCSVKFPFLLALILVGRAVHFRGQNMHGRIRGRLPFKRHGAFMATVSGGTEPFLLRRRYVRLCGEVFEELRAEEG